MKGFMTRLGVALLSVSVLATPLAHANNSESPQTIPVGLQAAKNYIPNAIFWVSAQDGTEARYRALRYDDLRYDIDEDQSHSYSVKLRLKAIDHGNLPVLECDATISYDYIDKEIFELSNNVFRHYCELY